MGALLWAAVLALGGGFLGAAHAHTGTEATPGGIVDASERPLGKSKLLLSTAPPARFAFRGEWFGASVDVDPRTTGAYLRVAGASAGEADTGIIRLPAERWKGRGKKLRYRDPRGRAGGIELVTLELNKTGGDLGVRAGAGEWRFSPTGPLTGVVVTLEMGGARWCADFHADNLRLRGGKKLRGLVREAPSTCPCSLDSDSTWAGVQAVFARHGCTAAVCHGASPGEGGLDLRPEVALRNLVGVASEILPAQQRVHPGDKNRSMLWRKLAALTLAEADVPGSAMPVGESALSEDELRLIELWIYNGAPATDVVPGSQALLGSCAPSAEPQKIPPPEPPPFGEGVQLHGAAWSVPVSGEDEVCYATYYDVSDRVPAENRAPCPPGRGRPGEECFFYKRAELVQDPNSHHSIPRVYLGSYDVTHPSFGPFTCHGGPQDGQSCNPKGLGTAAPAGAECGPGGGCAGGVVSSVACLGYGPPDFAFGFDLAQSANAPYILISTVPRYVLDFPAGVVEIMPVRGVMAWNSHAFNATDLPTTNEQWLRLTFASAEEQQFLLQDFFDIGDIFIANVPPFEQREYCRTVTFSKGTRLFEITSHTHKRGKLFQMWGPGVWPPCRSSAGQVCEPEPSEPFLVTTDYADPDQVIYDPPLVLDSDDPATRTFKYCALYDNGFTDPTNVKRRSTAPPGAGTCTARELRCYGGPRQGAACGGIDANCESAPGAGDGVCDACPARGGVAADDEMFAVIGSYYCAEGVNCRLPAVFPGGIPIGAIPGF
jgi:hypothetical protein